MRFSLFNIEKMPIPDDLRQCMILASDTTPVVDKKYIATGQCVRILGEINHALKYNGYIVVTFEHCNREEPMTIGLYKDMNAVFGLFADIEYALAENALIHGDAPHHWECRFYGAVDMSVFYRNDSHIGEGPGRGLPYYVPMDHCFLGAWKRLNGHDKWPSIEQPSVAKFSENDGDTTVFFPDAEACIKYLIDYEFTMHTSVIYGKGSEPQRMAIHKFWGLHFVHCPGAFTDPRLPCETETLEIF